MSEIKIEKGIPIPPDARGNANRKYPFHRMDIGDSILLSPKSRQTAYAYKFKHPEFCFVVRKEGKQVRLWRVANATNSNGLESGRDPVLTSSGDAS